MTGSVETAKDGVKRSPSGAKPSPEALLRQAVSRGAPSPSHAPAPLRRPMLAARTGRYAAVAVGSLVVGSAFGMLTAPKPSSPEGFAEIAASLQIGREQASRLDGQIEALSRQIAGLRESSEAARGESRSLGATVVERMSKIEQDADRQIAGLREAIQRAEREQTARLTGLATQIETRSAAQIVASPATPLPTAATSPKPDPVQTGSINEVKPKADAVETWALREVYNGVAMLEDRKRRLVEVAPGDSIPGVGRVESIERRGRSWVVVTRQGVITPQTW